MSASFTHRMRGFSGSASRLMALIIVKPADVNKARPDERHAPGRRAGPRGRLN
jgi:hypothetical protein